MLFIHNTVANKYRNQENSFPSSFPFAGIAGICRNNYNGVGKTLNRTLGEYTHTEIAIGGSWGY